jgi:hypothetical protein
MKALLSSIDAQSANTPGVIMVARINALLSWTDKFIAL